MANLPKIQNSQTATNRRSDTARVFYDPKIPQFEGLIIVDLSDIEVFLAFFYQRGHVSEISKIPATSTSKLNSAQGLFGGGQSRHTYISFDIVLFELASWMCFRLSTCAKTRLRGQIWGPQSKSSFFLVLE